MKLKTATKLSQKAIKQAVILYKAIDELPLTFPPIQVQVESQVMEAFEETPIFGLEMMADKRAAFEIEFFRWHGYGWNTKNGVVFTKVRWKDRTRGILQYWVDTLKFKDGNCQFAAIFRSCGMAVATRYIRDSEGMGIDIFDPWENA